MTQDPYEVDLTKCRTYVCTNDPEWFCEWIMEGSKNYGDTFAYCTSCKDFKSEKQAINWRPSDRMKEFWEEFNS